MDIFRTRGFSTVSLGGFASRTNQIRKSNQSGSNMWKTQIQKYVFSTLIILLLSACTKDFNNELTQEEAIEIAVKIVSMSMPEVSGSQVAPSNIVAEKMTVKKLAKQLNLNHPYNVLSEESPDTLVWLVSMDGLWFPANVPGVIQKPFHHLFIVIDAKTGSEIFRNMQP